MLEAKSNKLIFSFPKIHKDAILEIEFQRTFRIPDDGKNYNLPPGLGAFPIAKVEDYKEKLPAKWVERGGAIIPLSTSEAMWIRFNPHYVNGHGQRYPFAVKIASGKRSALTGNPWNEFLRENDYCIVPQQPWIDGFVVENGLIKQFIAVPMGMGASVEEQLTKSAEIGGLQIQVFPMKCEEFEKKYPKQEYPSTWRKRHSMTKCAGQSDCISESFCGASASASTAYYQGQPEVFSPLWSSRSLSLSDSDSRSTNTISVNSARISEQSLDIKDMGFGAGGSMKQQIFADQYGIDSWDTTVDENRVFVHIANSMVWKDITGKAAPIMPLSANDYNKHGYAWYEYYEDKDALNATTKMKTIKSVAELEKEKNISILPENTSVEPNQVIDLSPMLKNKDIVNDGQW